MLSPLIWTRSVADWDDDALLLPHHVRKVIHLPCLAVEFLQPPLPEGEFAYVIVTSANAIIALEQLPQGREKFAQATFICFGPKTREKAESCGYHTASLPLSSSANSLPLSSSANSSPRSSAITSAEQLAEHLLQALPASSRIAVLRAQQPAFALAETLAERFTVAEVVLYQTRNHVAWPSGEDISCEQKKALATSKHVICFASPATVEGFYRTFQQEHADWRENFHAVAIGATTARTTEKYFQHHSVSSTQSLAMLAQEAASLQF